MAGLIDLSGLHDKQAAGGYNRHVPSNGSHPMDRRTFLALGAGGAAVFWQLIGHDVAAAKGQSSGDWMSRRKTLMRNWLDLSGQFPQEKCPLAPTMREVAQKDGITRYHVSFAAEPDDRVTAWLLVPDAARGQKNPAIICVHGTTRGTGKDRTVGLAGKWPHDPPDKPPASRAYGLELARGLCHPKHRSFG